jgi:hypothetical protein
MDTMFGLFAVLVVWTVWAIALFGWVMNIVYLVDATDIGVMEVARILGIVLPPIGSGLGLVGWLS